LDFLLTLRLSGRLAVGYLLGKVLQALLHPYTFPAELGHHQKLGHALPADFLRQSIVAIYLEVKEREKNKYSIRWNKSLLAFKMSFWVLNDLQPLASPRFSPKNQKKGNQSLYGTVNLSHLVNQ